MVKQLLSKTMLLLCALMVGSVSVWADEYEIVFQSASSDSNTDLGATPTVSDVVSSGSDYVASFSSCSKMYVGVSGIKLGASKSTGTMNFSLASSYQGNIKTIKIVSAQYGSDTGTLTLYSGSTSLKTGITPGTDYIHTFDTPTTVTSIKLTTSAKRAYITKIVITTQTATDPTKADANLSFQETTFNVKLTDSFTAPVLNNPNNLTVTYTSDAENVATVNKTTGVVEVIGEGRAEITASFAGNDDFNAGSASYIINVIDPNKVIFTFSEDYGQTFVTDGYANEEFEYTDKDVDLYVEGRYRFWNSDKTLRMYKGDATYDNAALMLTAPSGKVITKIEFSVSVSALVPDYGIVSGKVWSGVANSVLFTHDGESSSVNISSITVTYGDFETVTITSAGYATYTSGNILDFSLVDGLTAYKATATAGAVSFSALEGGVKAEEGMLLKGNAGSYQVPVVATAAADVEGNAFVGVITSESIAAGSFVLMNGTKGIGFYKTTSAFTAGDHTAYLPASVAGARTFISFSDEATAIGAINSSQCEIDNSVYDLQGRRVSQPTKGLYIVNGKKVIF